MSETVRFPIKDKELDTYLVGVKDYIKDPNNKPRLGINIADETLLSDDEEVWTKNFSKLQDPNLCTTAVINEKTRLKKKIKIDFSAVLGKINPNILTTADRFALRMFLRNQGGPISVATWCPVFIVVSMNHLLLKFKFSNSDNPSSRKMPKGHRVYFESCIGLPNLADKDILFGGGVNISNAFFSMTFKDEDSGKMLYARAYYENRRSHRSPVSLVFRIIIP